MLPRIEKGFHTWVVSGVILFAGGAVAATDEHWAFQPLQASRVDPKTHFTGPIDYFIQTLLDERGLVAAGQADRRRLIRRATFNLTGLPPKRSAVEAFVADRSPNAYSKVVDRLLASPRYGERWGRH